MKLKGFIISSLLLSLCLSGCATRNNDDNDKVAFRNRNGMVPTRVNDNITNRDRVVTDNNYPNNGITNVRYNNDNLNNIGDRRSKMKVADQAANKVADLPEVDNSYVIVTENNAYVAAQLNNGDKLTNNLEKKISKQVKSVDRDIDRVFVSVNPDFYDHMRDYATDIRNGRPVAGFFEEFSQTIQRIFPDVK